MVAQTQKKRALSVERLPEGSTIGRQYRVVRLLGHGGLAWVYEVIDEPTGVPCAVKIFHPFFLSGEPRTSMLRERLARLRTLTHPNLNEVYGCAAHGLVQMQVCALCPGQSLDQFALRQLSRSPNQRVNDALTIAISAARAVGFASASLPGVFHGAIKPGNIRIRTDQTVMVLDFGLADIFDPGHVVALARRNNVTQYMAPELRDGVGLANARTDVYSLGAIFYHALTGQTPGMTVADPAQIFMFLPEQVSALCMRATHANPSERFNTPEEFAIAAADELERRIASGERIPSSTNHDRHTSSTADSPRRASNTANPSPRAASTPSMPGFDPTISPFDPAMRPHTPGSSSLPGVPGTAHRPLADEPRAASSGGAGSLLSAYATATERASHPAPIPDSATRPEPRPMDSIAEEAFFTQSFSAVPEEIRNTPASMPHAFHGVDAATVAKTAQPAAQPQPAAPTPAPPAPAPVQQAPNDADALSAARAEASIAELQRALVETGPLPKLADSIGDIQRLGDDFDPPKTAPDLPSVAEAPLTPLTPLAPLAPSRPTEPKPTTGNLPPHETSVENWLFAGGAAPIPTPEERASREEVFVQSASFAATQTPPVEHPPQTSTLFSFDATKVAGAALDPSLLRPNTRPGSNEFVVNAIGEDDAMVRPQTDETAKAAEATGHPLTSEPGTRLPVEPPLSVQALGAPLSNPGLSIDEIVKRAPATGVNQPANVSTVGTRPITERDSGQTWGVVGTVGATGISANDVRPKTMPPPPPPVGPGAPAQPYRVSAEEKDRITIPTAAAQASPPEVTNPGFRMKAGKRSSPLPWVAVVFVAVAIVGAWMYLSGQKVSPEVEAALAAALDVAEGDDLAKAPTAMRNIEDKMRAHGKAPQLRAALAALRLIEAEQLALRADIHEARGGEEQVEAQALAAKVTSLLEGGRGDAVEAYRQASADARVLCIMADYHRTSGDFERARPLVASLKKQNPNDRCAAFLDAAMGATPADEAGRAERLAAFTQRHPEHVRAIRLLAEARQNLGRFDDARRAYTSVLVAVPNHLAAKAARDFCEAKLAPPAPPADAPTDAPADATAAATGSGTSPADTADTTVTTSTPAAAIAPAKSPEPPMPVAEKQPQPKVAAAPPAPAAPALPKALSTGLAKAEKQLKANKPKDAIKTLGGLMREFTTAEEPYPLAADAFKAQGKRDREQLTIDEYLKKFPNGRFAAAMRARK